MNLKKKLIPLASAALLFTLTSQAALVWDQEKGWYAEGGVLEKYVGPDIDAGSALELMNMARKLQEKKSYFQALGVYETVIDDYAGSIYAPEALYQSARIHTERHQFEDAYNELDRIIKIYPDYPNFNRVVGQKFEIASQLMEGKRPFYWGVIPGFRDETSAMEYFEGIVKTAPFSRYAPVSLMNVALIAKKQGKTEEAIDALDRLITSYPQSVLAPDAYLNLAKTFASLVDGAYYDQGSTNEAIGYFQDFLILYPGDENISEAEKGLQNMRNTLSKSRLLVGDFYWRYRYNPTAAKTFLNDAITVAPDSDSAKEARALINKIESGANPPSTPVDWLFGKYNYETGDVAPTKESSEKTKAPKQTPSNNQETVPASWNS